jgi:hypothetical protein
VSRSALRAGQVDAGAVADEAEARSVLEQLHAEHGGAAAAAAAPRVRALALTAPRWLPRLRAVPLWLPRVHLAHV